MIRKLKLKFVAINMGIVTIMLCIILGLVFHFTRANLENESIAMLRNLAVQPFQPSSPLQGDGEVRLPYFVVQVRPMGTILSSEGGYYDLSDDELLADLVSETFSMPQDLGVIEDYALRYYRMATPAGYRLVFSDITSENATLDSLTRICLLIGGLGFLLFLGASVLLSKWAVKPMDMAWKQQRQFVADASHELKAPLAVIMTNAELLVSPEYDESDKGKFAGHILAVSRHMRGLIEQLLTLARSDSEQGQTSFQRVDFSALAEQTALSFEAAFFEKGLTLHIRTQRDIHVLGDPDQLRQVAEILLDNAQKYSTANGETWVTLKKAAGRSVLSVKNQGNPIEEKELPNLFRRFYRVNQARSRDGSFGLGLSIAASIVSRHKGKIWAESRDGVNCFYVELSCA